MSNSDSGFGEVASLDKGIPAEEMAVIRLIGKLGFRVTRGSIQYNGKSGVRPATEAEKAMWGALMSIEMEYAEAENSIMQESLARNEKAKKDGP